MNHMHKIGALALVLGLAGCPVDNYASIGILGSPGWEAETETDDLGNLVVTSCLAPGSAEVYYSDATYDVAVSNRFTRPFLVRNNLPDNADDTSGRLNTNDYVVDGAIIEYEGMDEATQSLVSPLSTEIALGVAVTSDGGQQGITVTLIPPSVGQVLADQLVPNPGDMRTVLATVTFTGTTLDGAGLDSQAFRFPVTVCRGCRGACDTADCICSH